MHLHIGQTRACPIKCLQSWPVWWRAERIGAISGFLTIAGLLGNLFFTRNAPEPDQPIARIASELAAHENAYLATAAFDAVQVFFFLVFAAALASLARRADEEGGWLWIAIVGGAAVAAALAFASALSLVAAVFSTHYADAGPGAVLASYELHTWFLVGTCVPGAVFLASTGAASLRFRILPRWLAWIAAVDAVAAFVGFGYIFGNELDGGPLGAVWALAGVALALWIVAVGIALLRGAHAGRPTAA
jgi:hypothetical protein